MYDTIDKYKIRESMIINMDESPYFWEYLPRNILASKLSKCAYGWKRGFHNIRSTLILAAAADGTLLRPSLILNRSTPYILKCNNEIDLLLNSPNGWNNTQLTKKWIEKILVPYVKNEHCLLVWDSFESHKCDDMLNFLKKYPNIHLSAIVGGMTSVGQPLDISINKKFKTICKKQYLKHTNKLLEFLIESNGFAQITSQISSNIIKSNHFLFIY